MFPKLKRPTLKNDKFLSLREFLYEAYEILTKTIQVRGDGNRVIVSQSIEGTTIKLLEDDYKKSFPLYVESYSGGQYSETGTFKIKGCSVSKLDVTFTLSPFTRMSIEERYLYLHIKNTGSSEAADLPTGDGETQQEISDDETKLFAKFVTRAEKETQTVKSDEMFILIGYQSQGTFFQVYTGDVYLGANAKPFVKIKSIVAPREYIGDVLKSPGGEVATADVIIKVSDIYSIDFSVGYGDFAEPATEEINGEPETVYYLPSVQMSTVYAKITGVTDPATYTADIYSALTPEPAYKDQTVIIPGATTNALPVGYEGVATRSGAGWIMEGFVLG